MGQLGRACIRAAIAAGLHRARFFPSCPANVVALTTRPTAKAILPTPSIGGGVGLASADFTGLGDARLQGAARRKPSCSSAKTRRRRSVNRSTCADILRAGGGALRPPVDLCRGKKKAQLANFVARR